MDILEPLFTISETSPEMTIKDFKTVFSFSSQVEEMLKELYLGYQKSYKSLREMLEIAGVYQENGSLNFQMTLRNNEASSDGLKSEAVDPDNLIIE